MQTLKEPKMDSVHIEIQVISEWGLHLLSSSFITSVKGKDSFFLKVSADVSCMVNGCLNFIWLHQGQKTPPLIDNYKRSDPICSSTWWISSVFFLISDLLMFNVCFSQFKKENGREDLCKLMFSLMWIGFFFQYHRAYVTFQAPQVSLLEWKNNNNNFDMHKYTFNMNTHWNVFCSNLYALF